LATSAFTVHPEWTTSWKLIDASPFVLWPFGIALGSWFFFEIARRM
jgi:hypothetical protein